MKYRAVLNLLIPLFFVVSNHSNAELLSPDQAFQVSVERINAQILLFHFEVAPGYALYRDKLKLSIADRASDNLPKMVSTPKKLKFVTDKDSAVYSSGFTVKITSRNLNRGNVYYSYQGCSTEYNVCYQAISKIFSIN